MNGGTKLYFCLLHIKESNSRFIAIKDENMNDTKIVIYLYLHISDYDLHLVLGEEKKHNMNPMHIFISTR